MEQKKETSRKEIIKKVAVVFFVMLLFLTFFSNTIMNYSLPEVATEPVTTGTVSNKVRGQGVVETNSEYDVTVSGARVVKEVKVEVGDTVEEGQVLFTFEEGENSELNEAEETLEQMELDYAKSLLKTMPDYASDDLDIKAAKEDLEAATKARDKAKKNAAELKAAKEEVAQIQKSIEEQQKKVDSLQEQVDAYGEVGNLDDANAQVTSLDNKLTTLKDQLAQLQQELADAGGNDVDIKAAIRELELEITNTESDLQNAKTIADNISKVSDGYKKAKDELAAANKALSNLQATLTKKSAKVDELSSGMSYEDAKAAVKEKRKTLTQMLLALKDKKEQDSMTQQADNLDMQAAQKKIEEQKEKIAKIKKSSDLKEVKSTQAGVVAQIDAKEGDSIAADTPIAKIQLSDSGYVVRINVTKAQGGLIRSGNEATLENVWDDETTAVVKSVKVNPENPNQSMIVTFEVKGNVEVGQNLSLSVGEKSNRYDAVVPNNAIREDSKGKFVLIVDVKGTPLGNRYRVRRADVEVLASDDTASGVTGGVYEYENVVTNASKPLEEGMQVRLKSEE